MTDFVEIEREEIAVQFVRVPDELDEITRAWNELEAVVALHGRHFYGAYDPIADDCRARLRGDPPAIYEEIKPTFDELTAQAKSDETRPSLEWYRRHDEIDLLLPV
jgi:hypothetical protein